MIPANPNLDIFGSSVNEGSMHDLKSADKKLRVLFSALCATTGHVF